MAANISVVAEADETFFQKSAKGSKKLVGRSPRKRGGTAKKGLSTDEHTPVLYRDGRWSALDGESSGLELDMAARRLVNTASREQPQSV